MRTMLKEVEGIDWGDAAVMNCRWKGPRLRDVLHRAGVRPGQAQSGAETENGTTLHVAFSSYQVPCQNDKWFGGSVELERGLSEDADVVLALEVCLTNSRYGYTCTLPILRGYHDRADRNMIDEWLTAAAKPWIPCSCGTPRNRGREMG